MGHPDDTGAAAPRTGPFLLPAAAAALLALALLSWHVLPTGGLRAYRVRAKPALVLGRDKVTKRNAAFIRMGLMTISPAFCRPHDLAADAPEAVRLYGQSCPPPSENRLTGARPPSTELLPPPRADLPAEASEVSVVCPAEDLFGTQNGLVIHPFERGSDWERPAWVTVRSGEGALWESPAGLRIHGGSSRVGPMKSFGLCFRESYGGFDASPPGMFLGPGAGGAGRWLLITAYEASQFNNVLATEIAGRLGCRISRAAPAVFHLNGTEILAPYFIVEHQSTEFVARQYGLKEVEWYRLKTGTERLPAFEEWRRWLRKEKTGDLDVHRSRFDIDDLCAWVLAMSFTSTTDNDQGAYFRDRSKPESPWHCLTWDLDAAFNTGPYTYKDRTVDAGRQCFDILVGDRSLLFFKLVSGSAEFRDYFRAFAERKLRNELTPERVVGIAQRHLDLARRLPNVPPAALEALESSRDFLARRHDFYFAALEELLAKGAAGEAHYPWAPQEEPSAGSESGRAAGDPRDDPRPGAGKSDWTPPKL